jgi:hypothetical protein
MFLGLFIILFWWLALSACADSVVVLIRSCIIMVLGRMVFRTYYSCAVANTASIRTFSELFFSD